MSLLGWNSMENSRHGIIDSIKCTSETIPLRLSSFEEILPPFPVVKNSVHFPIELLRTTNSSEQNNTSILK